MELREAGELVSRLVTNIEQVIYGKPEAIQLAVTGLLARGHLLIEDVPGIGKTTLAQGLARSIDCSFSRIQFTSDMLPSDIIGVSVLNSHTQDFEFKKGPIFAGVVLADEVNRTPPKTQSALLEAMSEGQVSAEGKSHPLPPPFTVLATQNPIEYEGTYNLPESQLDRFMLRLAIGYPDGEHEKRIMRRKDGRRQLRELQPAVSVDDVEALRETVEGIHVDESLLDYILEIVQATREDEHVQLGASPRSSQEFYTACQAYAMVRGRDYVTPADVREMTVPTLSHRIIVRSRGGTPAAAARMREQVLHNLLEQIPVPE